MSKSKLKMDAILKSDDKFKTLYLKNVVAFYSSVHTPRKKYESEEKEYSMQVFFDDAVKEKLEDEVLINKTCYKVGKDKTKKRNIKFPLSSQVEEGKNNYDIVEGMYGIQLTASELASKGLPRKVNVIGPDNKPFYENIGNGSVCTVKCFGYTNKDGMLVVMLDTIKVIEHVPYKGKTFDGIIDDDILGSYSISKAGKVEQPVAEEESEEDDLPF